MEIVMETDVLKEFVDVLGTLVEEAKLVFEKDGVKTSCVDPSHVAMVEASLNMDAFNRYSIEPIEMGVDLGKIQEFLGIGRADRVTIRHDEKKNRLVLEMGYVTRSMGLVDAAGFPDTTIPNLNLPNTAKVGVKYLRGGVKASGQLSDHIAVLLKPEGFEMIAEGDTDESEMVLPKDLLDEINAEQTARSLFPLDYFGNMVKAIKSKTVEILLGTDYPVKMRWDFERKIPEFSDGKETVKTVIAGSGLFLLAPRIESE